jgi:hypothetical protein
MALSACASAPSTRVEGVQVADESQVKGCTYLKDISRKQGWRYRVLGEWFGEYAQQGLEIAHSEVLHQAKELGATHIVWLPKVGDRPSPQVSAKAYRCGG